MSEASGIFDTGPPRYFSIDAGRPFLNDLARAVRAAIGGDDPLAISDALIYVPTRRAARALAEAFVQTAPNARASLLPQIKPLGDIDEDEFLLFEGDASDEVNFPPAVTPLRRLLVLANLVARRDRQTFDGQENWAAALGAANELAKLLDSFYTEEISFDELRKATPTAESLARHWRDSLEFLEIITKAWPAYLAENQCMDPSERRVKLINAQATRWERMKPAHPIIIAGTTGSAPSVARLMRVAAQLPKGCVVLPGFDRALAKDEKAWCVIDDPHPQAGLKALLEHLDLKPDQIRAWPQNRASPERTALLSLALRPALATDDWLEKVAQAKTQGDGFRKAISGLHLIEAEDEENEAGAVALMMRETLETPKHTAMLVTPDRDLTRRVAAKLRRWGIRVDDSAGLPFSNSPCGTYIRLVATWLQDVSEPVALMALLRHPLCGLSLNDAARKMAVNATDQSLRGLRPTTGFSGLNEKLKADDRRSSLTEPVFKALEAAAGDWSQNCGAPFSSLLTAHIRAAEMLAASDMESGATRLWRGEDGATGALLFAELTPLAPLITTHQVGDYANIFDQLLAGRAVRPRAGAHPRLSILGPLEARLQGADRVIVSGLNEGVWPADAGVDPFLSRTMRKEIGLPSHQRRVGLSAHDFAQLAATPNVILTRAARSGGAPAKPSRWIVRLKNILKGADALDGVDQTLHYQNLANRLDKPEVIIPTKAPMPTPPIAARPRKLSVTRIERWLRDPYGIYARYVLNLRRLDPLGETFDRRQVGRLLHKVFEDYCRQDGETDGAETAGHAHLHALLSEYGPLFGLTLAQLTFWRASFDAAFTWFANWNFERRAMGVPVVIEGDGEWTFETTAAPFTLTARADRIDRLANGAAAIFDYKSGVLPSLKQAKTFNPQLPLTGLIVSNGGFANLEQAAVESFYYLKTLNRKGTSADSAGTDGEDALRIMAEAEDGLRALIARYDDLSTSYPSQPRPEYTDDYGDYDHLARRREWSEAEGEE